MGMTAPEQPPPELMMMLAGQGPPGMGGPPGIGGPQGPPQPEQPQGPRSSVELIAAAIDLLRGYPEVEQDQEDLAVAAQVIAALQKLLAKQQREADTATGVGPAARFLRRG